MLSDEPTDPGSGRFSAERTAGADADALLVRTLHAVVGKAV
jgi:hypothetical protein